MRSLTIVGRCLGIILVLLAVPVSRYLHAQSDGTYVIRVKDKEAVLFPFDNEALPFRSGVQLNLQGAGRVGKDPIIPRGDQGQPDSVAAAFYGTVIPVGNEYRMWYLCGGDREKGYGMSWMPETRLRVCYAVSKDGVKWQKPKLGLVTYGGSKENNLVALDPIKGDAIATMVLDEPDASDPQKRFKMIYENHGGSDSAAYSPDGLTWTNSTRNPVIKPVIEPSGLVKHDGMYYLVGHGDFEKRVLVVDASADFDHWVDPVVVGFRRDNLGPLKPHLSGGRAGEQVHLGAALWDRGNVILGLYGQWHGPSPESNDRRDMRLDIGFVISHDAMHYYEPIPDFKMIGAADVKFPIVGFIGRLVQGQAFLNIGDRTLTYYSLWGPSGGDGIYLASWARDRLGYYSVTVVPQEGQAPLKDVAPQFISCPIWLDKPQTKVFVNASGLGQHTNVTVELLDENFREIPGFSGADSMPLSNSGFREGVRWRNKEGIPKFDRPVRLRVKFGGLQGEHARVYALYLD